MANTISFINYSNDLNQLLCSSLGTILLGYLSHLINGKLGNLTYIYIYIAIALDRLSFLGSIYHPIFRKMKILKKVEAGEIAQHVECLPCTRPG